MEMEKRYMLTTLDNPYNPFVDFTSWYMFDCERGHNTCSRLARIINESSEMTQKEIDEERNRAIDFIIKYDFEDKYVAGTEEQLESLLELRRTKKYEPEINEQNATVTNA